MVKTRLLNLRDSEIFLFDDVQHSLVFCSGWCDEALVSSKEKLKSAGQTRGGMFRGR